MARFIKGAKRYVLLRGKDDQGRDIVIDVFDKKTLDMALKDQRVSPDDSVVMVQVLGRADLKKPKRLPT